MLASNSDIWMGILTLTCISFPRFLSSSQVYGHTCDIQAIFYRGLPYYSGVRLGHHQSFFIVFQLRFNIPSGAVVATDNYVFILWNVFNRLFVPHVFLGESRDIFGNDSTSITSM